MTKAELYNQIVKKKSYLCVGLDTDPLKIPNHLKDHPDPIFEFNRQIIDATAPFAVAFKPNLAFYEGQGINGLISLEKTLRYCKLNYPDILMIADAKRGDIGNTSALYARAFFEESDFDALTLAPYMGKDSITPFLGYPDKWIIVLALTSNPGAFDFQFLKDEQSGLYFFEKVLQTVAEWGSDENTMFVVGATKSEYIRVVRNHVPNHFLLVPGVGAQGGSLEEISRMGMNAQVGLLVNSSRNIIYASGDKSFAADASREAEKMQLEMANLLDLFHK
jgi:orotidine-5'-phosphate decarboxylase